MDDDVLLCQGSSDGASEKDDKTKLTFVVLPLNCDSITIIDKIMGAGRICLQCHKELQENPTARAKNQGKKMYEVRDRMISPIEIRCIRCHRRLARNDKCFDSTLRPVQLALGLVFVGCESVYGGVKGAVHSIKGSPDTHKRQHTQESMEEEFPTDSQEELPMGPPPNYQEATGRS